MDESFIPAKTGIERCNPRTIVTVKSSIRPATSYD